MADRAPMSLNPDIRNGYLLAFRGFPFVVKAALLPTLFSLAIGIFLIYPTLVDYTNATLELKIYTEQNPEAIPDPEVASALMGSLFKLLLITLPTGLIANAMITGSLLRFTMFGEEVPWVRFDRTVANLFSLQALLIPVCLLLAVIFAMVLIIVITPLSQLGMPPLLTSVIAALLEITFVMGLIGYAMAAMAATVDQGRVALRIGTSSFMANYTKWFWGIVMIVIPIQAFATLVFSILSPSPSDLPGDLEPDSIEALSANVAYLESLSSLPPLQLLAILTATTIFQLLMAGALAGFTGSLYPKTRSD